MKKILALMLALVMVFALCSCGEEAAPAADDTKAPASEAEAAPEEIAEPDAEVLAYVEENYDTLLASVASIGDNGNETEIYVDGASIVFEIVAIGYNDVSDDALALFQSQMSTVESAYAEAGAIDAMRAELPTLESMVYNVFNENGEMLGTFTIG